MLTWTYSIVIGIYC